MSLGNLIFNLVGGTTAAVAALIVSGGYRLAMVILAGWCFSDVGEELRKRR